MSLPDDTLRKAMPCSLWCSISRSNLSQILSQIQQQSQQSQKALSLAVAQTGAKQREQRMVQLTLKELESLQGDVTVYKGLGKAWVVGLKRMAGHLHMALASLWFPSKRWN
jgi:hypothetical protein